MIDKPLDDEHLDDVNFKSDQWRPAAVGTDEVKASADAATLVQMRDGNFSEANNLQAAMRVIAEGTIPPSYDHINH